MMDAFKRPQGLIDWAREALAEADADARAFFDPKNFRYANEVDPKTGEQVRLLRLVAELPDAIPRRFTEALNNARNSFDQSLFAACEAIGKPITDAHYPWADNPDPSLTYRMQRKGTGEELIRSEFWDTIRAQEPYPRGEGYSGGDDVIRQISTIANRKHTIGVEIRGTVMGAGINMDIKSNSDLFRLVIPSWDPVKNEIELLRTKSLVLEGEPEYNLSFDIVLNVSPPVGDIPAKIAIATFVDKAQSVLDGFKARAVELGVS